MSLDKVSERFSKIRAMRKKLCDQEKVWNEAFAARDWVVSQIRILHEMTDKTETSIEDLRERIADILCVLDPSNTDGDSDE